MAYFVRHAGNRIEVRESRSTAKGPRSRQLARFVGPLTPAVLAKAAERATRPFDPEALVRRARVLGIPVEARGSEPEARALLARLRRADPIDPGMAAVLVRALEGTAKAELPEQIADVADWIGAPASARGAALRDLLDAFGRIESARPPRRERPRRPYPRLSSTVPACAPPGASSSASPNGLRRKRKAAS